MTRLTANGHCKNAAAMITGHWGKPSEVFLDIMVEPDGVVRGVANPEKAERTDPVIVFAGETASRLPEIMNVVSNVVYGWLYWPRRLESPYWRTRLSLRACSSLFPCSSDALHRGLYLPRA